MWQPATIWRLLALSRMSQLTMTQRHLSTARVSQCCISHIDATSYRCASRKLTLHYRGSAGAPWHLFIREKTLHDRVLKLGTLDWMKCAWGWAMTATSHHTGLLRWCSPLRISVMVTLQYVRGEGGMHAVQEPRECAWCWAMRARGCPRRLIRGAGRSVYQWPAAWSPSTCRMRELS